MRHSLRTILALTAILACCFACLNSRTNQNRHQRQAVQQIWRMGGGVAFVGGSRFEQPLSSNHLVVELTSWLGDVVRPRTASKIALANHGELHTEIDDSDIPQLVRIIKLLPELEEVRIRNTAVSSDGLYRLRDELPNVTVSFW